MLLIRTHRSVIVNADTVPMYLVTDPREEGGPFEVRAVLSMNPMGPALETLGQFPDRPTAEAHLYELADQLAYSDGGTLVDWGGYSYGPQEDDEE